MRRVETTSISQQSTPVITAGAMNTISRVRSWEPWLSNSRWVRHHDEWIASSWVDAARIGEDRRG